MIPVINRFNDKHQQLLGLVEGDSTREVLDEVFNFLKELVQAGTDVTDARQRSHLRGLIRFWSSYAYDRTGEFHQVQLLPSTGASKTNEEELSLDVVPSTDGESYEPSSMAKDSNNGHGTVIERLKDLPATIGPYEVFEEIGEGGFSTVYLARDTRRSKMVALKVLKNRLFLTSADFRRSLIKREKDAVSYSHPNIIPVYEVAEYEGLACTAMKWVGDGSLADFMTGSYWRPTIGEILHIIGQAVDGLTYLHGLGIVHGDIKPANLLITVDHHVYLTDFGITQLIESAFQGIRVGTPEYMAPESILHPDAIDGKADIYGLGIVLFQLLMGRPPFTAQSEQEVIYHQVNRPVPDMDDVPDAIADVVRKCLAKNPDERYANTEEFQADINLLLDSLPPDILGTAPLHFITPPHNRYRSFDTTTLRRPTDMPVGAPVPAPLPPYVPPPLGSGLRGSGAVGVPAPTPSYVPPPPPPAPAMPPTFPLPGVSCPHCGARNMPGSAFCDGCGFDLSQGTADLRTSNDPHGPDRGASRNVSVLPLSKLLAILMVRKGLASGKDHFLVRESRSLIGCGQYCEVTIPDPSISGFHALLVYKKPEGKRPAFSLLDLASASGTLVNDQAIRNWKPLKDGDIITLGAIELMFKRLDNATEPEPFATNAAQNNNAIAHSRESGIFTDFLEPNVVLCSRYRVIGLIARGGASSVYMAEDLTNAGLCAIKRPAIDALSSHKVTISLLENEARILLNLSHHNIIQAKDSFYENGIPHLVLEYLQGVPLGNLLELESLIGERFCSESMVRALAVQLCEALTYLHTQSPPIIHRDVRPGNVFVSGGLDADGEVKLFDFGTARTHKPGQKTDTLILGTSGYAAPEQYGHDQTDARTDIYGLGATMYSLLIDQYPPLIASGSDAISVHDPNAKVPIEMSAIIKKAMQWDRTLRFQSAEEMKLALLALNLK